MALFIDLQMARNIIQKIQTKILLSLVNSFSYLECITGTIVRMNPSKNMLVEPKMLESVKSRRCIIGNFPF